jgi:hypothetical protein
VTIEYKSIVIKSKSVMIEFKSMMIETKSIAIKLKYIVMNLKTITTEFISAYIEIIWNQINFDSELSENKAMQTEMVWAFSNLNFKTDQIIPRFTISNSFSFVSFLPPSKIQFQTSNF